MKERVISVNDGSMRIDTSPDHFDRFPFWGVTRDGRERLVRAVEGEMGLTADGAWRHFVKFTRRTPPEVVVHYDAGPRNSRPYRNMTLCGKRNNASRVLWTLDHEHVTCARCGRLLEELQ